MTNYRIEYSIQRETPEDEDFIEVGFGSSGVWGDIDQCTHMLSSAVACAEWETTGDMPEPREVYQEAQGVAE